MDGSKRSVLYSNWQWNSLSSHTSTDRSNLAMPVSKLICLMLSPEISNTCLGMFWKVNITWNSGGVSSERWGTNTSTSFSKGTS